MSHRRTVENIVAFLALYASVRLGQWLAIPPAYISPVWPASAAGLVCVLLSRTAVWPAILGGTFVAYLQFLQGFSHSAPGGSAWAAFGMATITALQAALSAFVFRRWVSPSGTFDTPGAVYRFVALALGLCAVSASLYQGVLSWFGYYLLASSRMQWFAHWLGSAAALLTFVPPILLLAHDRPGRAATATVARMSEGILLVLLVLAVSIVAFGYALVLRGHRLPLPFLVFPFLIWAAFRFSLRLLTTSVVLMSAVAIAATRQGIGPFLLPSINEALLVLQVYLATVAVTALSGGIVIEQRDRTMAALEEARRRTEAEVRGKTAALRDANERLREAQRIGRMGNWEEDFTTGRMIWSEQMYALFERDPAQGPPSPQELIQYYRPEDAAEILELIRRCAQRGESAAGGHDALTRLPSGRLAWYTSTIEPVRNARGRVVGVRGVLQDITDRKDAEEALRESEVRFRAAFEQAAVGMAHFSDTGHWARVNDKFARMLGYTPEELIGKHFSDITHPDDLNACMDLVRDLFVNRQDTFQAEKRWRRKDGGTLWAQMSVSSVRGERGRIRYFSAVCVDITERKLNEQRLQATEAQLRLAASIAMLGFWEWDLRSDEVFLSPEWKKQLGYEDWELANRHEEWSCRVHPDDLEPVTARLREYLEGPRPELEQEYRMRHKDGSYRWVASRIIRTEDETGKPVLIRGIHLDITGHKEVEEQIRRMSQHDTLTGLPNRALLYEFGEHLLSLSQRTGSRTAFFFIDLDRFKPINDTYGHEIGDALLKEVARRLTQCVRGEDMVGRLGGDEFLALVSRVAEDDAAIVARHVAAALAAPYHLDGLELSVSPSIGISLYPQDGESVDALIRNADTAMYHAKESGRNTFQFFKRELNERAAQALRIESRLREGVEQGEFELFYQPVIDTETRAVLSAEALLRWPKMKAEPEQFIPVAETAGFMNDLGGWVVKEACRQQREWQNRGFATVPLAINVSPTQFQQSNFAHTIDAALTSAHLDPKCISIEVTESTVMKNVEDAAEVLHALQQMGIEVALDDFGTGYSSLSYLSQLPIDILKLDKSFVREIGRNRASIAVAESVLALARSLQLEVIAEGIESEESLAFLRSRHCRRGQGFHLCRPMPARAFEQWCWGPGATRH